MITLDVTLGEPTLSVEGTASNVQFNVEGLPGALGLSVEDPSSRVDLSLTVGGLTVINKRGASGIPAATAIAKGSLVYITPLGFLGLASAAAEGKEAIGFAAGAFAQGDPTTFYGAGDVITGLSGLTVGTPYFLSPTPGAIGAAPGSPGQVVQNIGTAISATEILFTLALPITI